MSINEFMQRRFLLNKAGLGTPRAASSAQPNQTTTQNEKVTNPAPAQPKKPGCSVCSRRKPS